MGLGFPRNEDIIQENPPWGWFNRQRSMQARPWYVDMFPEKVSGYIKCATRITICRGWKWKAWWKGGSEWLVRSIAYTSWLCWQVERLGMIRVPCSGKHSKLWLNSRHFVWEGSQHGHGINSRNHLQCIHQLHMNSDQGPWLFAAHRALYYAIVRNPINQSDPIECHKGCEHCSHFGMSIGEKWKKCSELKPGRTCWFLPSAMLSLNSWESSSPYFCWPSSFQVGKRIPDPPWRTEP